MHLRRACGVAGAFVMVGAMSSAYQVLPASAAPKSVTCSSLSGNLSATPSIFTLSGCSGNTGGSGTAEGNTIRWHNGFATYLATPAFALSGKPMQANCGSLSDKWSVSDLVAKDYTGSIRSGGKVSAKVCVQNEIPDPWSLAPRSVFILR